MVYSHDLWSFLIGKEWEDCKKLRKFLKLERARKKTIYAKCYLSQTLFFKVSECYLFAASDIMLQKSEKKEIRKKEHQGRHVPEVHGWTPVVHHLYQWPHLQGGCHLQDPHFCGWLQDLHWRGYGGQQGEDKVGQLWMTLIWMSMTIMISYILQGVPKKMVQ